MSTFEFEHEKREKHTSQKSSNEITSLHKTDVKSL